MIPVVFVLLTNSTQIGGKIDRRSLTRPEKNRQTLDQPYAPVTSDVEQQLIEIWEDDLDIRSIRIYDNFLELGGHSLTATQVVAQVITRFQIELPLQSLFQSPTVAEMAAVITDNQAKNLDEGSWTGF